MTTKTLTVAAVQYDIAWRDKSANFATLEDMVQGFFAARTANEKPPVDILLLPETFSTGFCVNQASVKEPADGGVDLEWLKKMAQHFNCVLAGSVFVAHQDKKANRFYWVTPAGDFEYYDKRHLFRLGSEGDFVAQGQARKVFEYQGVRFLPQVCYDLRFPVWSRNRQDYDVMINIANWPAVRRSAWDVLLKARAIENQAYVIGVNRVGEDGHGVAHSGGSCVLDYTGQVLKAAQDDAAQIITHELDIPALIEFKKDFPAFLDADDFELGFSTDVD